MKRKITWWEKEINYFMNHFQIDSQIRKEQPGRTAVEWFIYKISLHKWFPSYSKLGIWMRKELMNRYKDKYL